MTDFNSSGTSVVRELEAGSEGGSLHILEQVPESLTYSVYTLGAQNHGGTQWKPNGTNTAFPAKHVQLPYGVAVELCQFLNGIEERVNKGFISVVSRRVKGFGDRFDVLSIQGSMEFIDGRFVRQLKGCRLQGASIDDAIKEANRINGEIMRYASVPRVWAVIVVDGTGEAVQS